MFTKLNINFDVESILAFKSEMPNNKYTERFIEYKVTDLSALLDIIHKKIKFTIAPNSILFTDIIGPGVPAHCDRWVTAMNIYLNAGKNDTTTFYNHDSSGVQVRQVKVFSPDKLIYNSSFVAEQGQCWLLNTHMPHDVKIEQAGFRRSMLRITWENVDFHTVLNSINIT